MRSHKMAVVLLLVVLLLVVLLLLVVVLVPHIFGGGDGVVARKETRYGRTASIPTPRSEERTL